MSIRFVIYNTFFLFILVVSMGAFVYAQEVDELRGKIDTQQQELQKLDEEITGYERELTSVSRKKQTLQSSVLQFDISRRKVNTTIKKTKKQINITKEEIEQTTQEIKTKEEQININAEALAAAIREMHEQDSNTFVEIFLRSSTFGDVWSDIETLRRFQSTVQVRVGELGEYKKTLEDAVKEAKSKQETLSNYQYKLGIQKNSLDINRNAKHKLLLQTKNKESNYQALLAKKRKTREEFEQQLAEYESKLRYVLDPSALPASGKGILRWPLDRIRITQHFGNTKFAKTGAYNGKGHNGVDFGIPLGTPVKAAASGVVFAIGNTDAYPGCLSYGKWILLKHNNGLSTLYAHTSKVVRSPGESVKVGDVIAYSGSSGYSTGPHLHLAAYASSGVKVVKIGDIRNSRNCKEARIPIAPWKAYLNPMDYL